MESGNAEFDRLFQQLHMSELDDEDGDSLYGDPLDVEEQSRGLFKDEEGLDSSFSSFGSYGQQESISRPNDFLRGALESPLEAYLRTSAEETLDREETTQTLRNDSPRKRARKRPRTATRGSFDEDEDDSEDHLYNHFDIDFSTHAYSQGRSSAAVERAAKPEPTVESPSSLMGNSGGDDTDGESMDSERHDAGGSKSGMVRFMPQADSGLQSVANEQFAAGVIAQLLHEPMRANSVTVVTPIIVQKSYAPERRYLHPVPAIWVKSSHASRVSSLLSMSSDMPFDPTEVDGLISDTESITSDMDEERSVFRSDVHDTRTVTWQNSSGQGVVQAFYFKRAYLSTSQTNMYAHVSTSSNSSSSSSSSSASSSSSSSSSSSTDMAPMGVFPSSEFKVITKPIKKYAKRNDVSIKAGSDVCVMHRSKGSCNMYLSSGKKGIQLNQHAWEHFRVHSSCQDGASLPNKALIELVNDWGVSTGPLRVVHLGGRSSDKCRLLVLDQNTPVICLDDVAFMVCKNKEDLEGEVDISDDTLFLTVSNDGSIEEMHPMRMIGGEWSVGACGVWSLVSAAKRHFRFTSLTKDTDQLSITPFPLVHSVKPHNLNSAEVRGENLTDDLSVWFGTVRCATEWVSDDLLICKLPEVQNWQGLRSSVPSYCSVQLMVPITMTRSDGVVFPTDATFALSPSGITLGQRSWN